jgi:hypothetical protein
MSRRAQYEVPAGLKEAQQRFVEWRSAQPGRWPIPERLWALATELAGQHGVFRTAQVLRLDYNKLKQRTRTPDPPAKPTTAPQPTFVELITPPNAHPCECIIEVEGPRGRMRIEWKGSTAPDLSGLSRLLWEPSD